MTETITLKKGCRNRFYFVIVMPLDEDGRGPASEENGEIRKLTWEVWGQDTTSHGSFKYLPDAIDRAEELNTGAVE